MTTEPRDIAPQEPEMVRVGPFSFRSDSPTYAVCDRLHDRCRAAESDCKGPEYHYIELLNVAMAIREQPVEARMEMMGMTRVGVSRDGYLYVPHGYDTVASEAFDDLYTSKEHIGDA